MNEEIKDTAKDSKTLQKKNSTKKRKKESSFLRIVALVLFLCVAVFGAIIISDIVSKRNTQEETQVKPEPEFITIQVSADSILLDGKEVTLSELESYLDDEEIKGTIPVISLISDTENPPSASVYNQVADLLEDYGVEVERMIPSSSDEIPLFSTQDEI